MAANVPGPVSPYSLAVVVPALFLSEMAPGGLPRWGAFACVGAFWAVVYVAWTLAALGSAPAVPRRSKLLFGAAALLSALHLAVGARYGVEYQGLGHTVWVIAAGIVSVGLLAALLASERKAPSSRKFAAFHAGLFCWLGWVAYPWLGELI